MGWLLWSEYLYTLAAKLAAIFDATDQHVTAKRCNAAAIKEHQGSSVLA